VRLPSPGHIVATRNYGFAGFPTHVLMLPPHTTHKTQPLDVGCFGPLKASWTQRCEEHLELFNESIPRSNFVQEYLNVRDQAMTPELVRSAFRKTGIAPFNRAIFGDADFGPSHASSTQAHLPDAFPGQNDVPDLMDIVDSDSEEEDGTDVDGMDVDSVNVWQLSDPSLAGIDNLGAWPSIS
jgi:hypothetical protein